MKFIALLSATAIGLSTLPVLAQDGPSPQMKARQGLMWNNALNLGLLGKMAKGDIPFDAAKAQEAADTLVAISHVSMSMLWPEGSDSFSSDLSRAEPAIWDKPADFAAKWNAFGEAAVGLQNAVAGGQAALGPAVGAAGGACKGCHETYRTPKK